MNKLLDYVRRLAGWVNALPAYAVPRFLQGALAGFAGVLAFALWGGGCFTSVGGGMGFSLAVATIHLLTDDWEDGVDDDGGRVMAVMSGGLAGIVLAGIVWIIS